MFQRNQFSEKAKFDNTEQAIAKRAVEFRSGERVRREISTSGDGRMTRCNQA
jgi:hypothetical protein